MNSFYEELYKELSNENEIIDDKICLITNEPLLDDCVTLECKHTFNYNAIFQEIKKQKYHPFKYEVDKLTHFQLKCPYCRYIQGWLLPPPKEYFINKDRKYLLNGVNSPLHYCKKTNTCKYVYKRGSKKNENCDTLCFKEYCNYHEKQHEKQVEKNLKQEGNEANKKKKKAQPEIHKCQCIIKSGKRKGETCNTPYKVLVDDIYYCGRHKPK